MFLKLETFNPNIKEWNSIYINMDKIETINPDLDTEGSLLSAKDGHYMVKERPSLIAAMLESR